MATATPQLQSQLESDLDTGTSAVSTSPAAEPEHEEIARLAHSYWLNRSPEEGSAEEDWLRAERELRGRKSEGVR